MSMLHRILSVLAGGVLAAACCLDKPPADLKIRITSPADGAMVDLKETVEGTVSDRSQRLYVLVHPMETNLWWVQRLPGPAGSDGRWRTVAFFGTRNEGLGEQFEVVALATCRRLKEGGTIALGELPEDAVQSDTILVTRHPV